MRRQFLLILFICLSVFVQTGCSQAPSSSAAATVTAEKQLLQFQKGMCYVTWNKERYASDESEESIKRLGRTGAQWVALVTTWYQDKCFSTSVYSTVNSPTDESIIHAIRDIHAMGMKVMLKPHLDLLDTSGGSWRGEIACISEPDWDAWFNSYANFILHYAKIAQDEKVELYCIGTELTTIATMRGKVWKEKIINPVRKIYKGPLTYAANWNEEFQHVTFWDALDYVGIDAYFPLSEKDSPTLDEIKEGWKQWVAELEDFQAKVNKPIIFPEVGYCSAEGTARTPWEDLSHGRIDIELQKDCYEALYETFWGKEWFYGMYWWKWGTDVRFGGMTNKGYSLQNKPSENVVKEWYKRPVPNVKKFYAL